MNMQNLEVENLKFSWSANVKLKNGLEMLIWYTCWNSIKPLVAEILSISSDYPKFEIKQS